jgi:hypothetical protein
VVGAVEQGDEADEAFGGMVCRMDMPPHARAGRVGRGHRFAAYPRCSADGALGRTYRFRVAGGAPPDELRMDGYRVWARLRRLRITHHGPPSTDRRPKRLSKA